MKNSFRSSGRGLPRIVFLIVLGLLLTPAFAPVTALAENVTYSGDPAALQDITDAWGGGGGGYDKSVAPSGSVGGKSPSLSGNKVIVYGGTADHVFGAVNTQDSSAVTGNQVIINGGTVNNWVVGGFHEILTGSATASGNTVTINDSTVGSVSGGYAYVDSGDGSAQANNNSVSISGGETRYVYGGEAYSDSGDATATGNSVIISGGEVQGNVYGGYAQSGGVPGSATATHNTVTISGSPKFTNSELFGGRTTGAGWGDAFTGNTLNVWNYKGSSVNSVYNFQFLNFLFPSTQGNDPVLRVTGTAYLGDQAGRGATITASTIGGTAPLQPGSQVTLIAGDLNIDDFTQTQASGKHGATVSYLWNLDATSDLVATVANLQAAPEAKVLSEGYIAGLALINQGADLIAGKGIMNALSAAGPRGASGFGSFAAISGGWSRYNTGSHVDVSGLSLLTGLSFGADLTPGRLTLGAFFEFGTGSYDTYNSFGNVDAKGNGNMYHLGGGVLGRMDFTNTGPGNFYTEASARAGGVHNEYRTSALRDAMGNSAKGYDSDSPYYGIHLGAGYLWKFMEKASVDLYGKYFWTRQQGDTVTLSTGDPVKFKDTDSHRLRLGGRFAYAVNEYVTPYAGAAWEHEFDGRQKATTYGYKIDTVKLEGSTGIGELGLTLTPSKTLPLSFDLGVQGYVGKREGVTGSLQARFEF